jgi:hypothetical protein
MKPDEERLAQLHALLIDRVEQIVTGDDWTKFLTESQKFHRYSPTNRMLIAAQLIERDVEPDGLTASYKTWKRIPAVDGDTCQVRRGESALWIYAPMTITRRETDEASGEDRVIAAGVRGFKLVPVFHQSQLTALPDITEPPSPKLLQGHEAPARVWDAVVSELMAAGFAVEVVPREPGVTWNGRTDFSANEVHVHADLEPPQRLKTLAHEWAHVSLDHGRSTGGPSRSVAEVEAESVAFLVMATVGIDASDYTMPYVSGWAGGSVDTVKATAERVLATTAKLVDRLGSRLDIDLTPDPLVASAISPDHAQPNVEHGGAALATAADRLLPAEQRELLERPAPERLAYLLASAGFDAVQAVETFRDLGVRPEVTTTALTAIYPTSDALGDPESSLYSQAEVSAVVAEPSGPGGPLNVGHGLRLIEEWSAMEAMRPPLQLDLGLAGGIR